jgi:hypothetical protein
MVLSKFRVLILGLGALIPASATITYQSSQANFATQATVTDGLTLSSLITFTGTLSTVGGVTDDAYVDPTTGIEFLAFNSTGSANAAFTLTAGHVLDTGTNSGDAIEVIFPTGVDYGFAFNFTTAASFNNLCVDTSIGGCNSGGTVVTTGGSSFVGALNDNPTPAALSTIWMHPGSFSPDTDLQSFEAGSESATPDGPTMLLIGGGLIALHFVYRRKAISGAIPASRGPVRAMSTGTISASTNLGPANLT